MSDVVMFWSYIGACILCWVIFAIAEKIYPIVKDFGDWRTFVFWIYAWLLTIATYAAFNKEKFIADFQGDAPGLVFIGYVIGFGMATVFTQSIAYVSLRIPIAIVKIVSALLLFVSARKE